jgi:hypothetical protein
MDDLDNQVVECPPFAGYAPDRNSVFMSLDLWRS